jgi:hypothetical protein
VKTKRPVPPLFGLLLVLLLFPACRQSSVDQALDSDANGYYCAACDTEFYTAREVFANHCPKCKQTSLQQVLGHVCSADKHVTLAPRGRARVNCEQCGKPTASLSIPRAKDLETWGAAKKSAAEVGVN